uniref:Uncharacterized protein n=1 Tax=Glossina austeni TaxID=7395 RepID=A0A1A9VJF5_GLOAU
MQAGIKSEPAMTGGSGELEIGTSRGAIYTSELELFTTTSVHHNHSHQNQRLVQDLVAIGFINNEGACVIGSGYGLVMLLRHCLLQKIGVVIFFAIPFNLQIMFASLKGSAYDMILLNN